jgi:hypothetical protein
MNNYLALQPAINPRSSYLHNIVGKVIELHFPYRAVVAFNYKGKQERALLKADKLIVDGQNVGLVCSDPYSHSCSRNVNQFSFVLADVSSMHACKPCSTKFTICICSTLTTSVF